MADIKKKVMKGLGCCLNGNVCNEICPYSEFYYDNISECTGRLMEDAFELLKEQPMWNDASKRPPKQGRYLVWGLHEFTPDHNDQPNAYWQTRIATWFDKTGWDTKVKFWMELPEPPENKGW